MLEFPNLVTWIEFKLEVRVEQFLKGKFGAEKNSECTRYRELLRQVMDLTRSDEFAEVRKRKVCSRSSLWASSLNQMELNGTEWNRMTSDEIRWNWVGSEKNQKREMTAMQTIMKNEITFLISEFRNEIIQTLNSRQRWGGGKRSSTLNKRRTFHERERMLGGRSSSD